MKPWLIYALGGGWGHLNRAIALGRVVAQKRPARILTNSPYANIVRAALRDRFPTSHPSLQLQPISPQLNLEATRRQVQEILWKTTYDRLIIDTFPRGLGGELVEVLPHCNIPRVLIHRDLNPDYVQQKGIPSFVMQHYHGVLIPGEGDGLPLAHLPNVSHTEPWLICDSKELFEWITIRSSLAPLKGSNHSLNDIDCVPPIIIICATGNPSELSFFGQLTPQLQAALPDTKVYCLATTCPPQCPSDRWLCHYPAIDYLQVADVVVGGGGYNLVYECRALNVPLISFALPRLYDRQSRRLQRYGHPVSTPQAAIETLITILAQCQPIAPRCPIYRNGAIDAVSYIAALG